MKSKIKNHIEVSDLAGYKGGLLLLSGHNRTDKKLHIRAEIGSDGEIYTHIELEWCGEEHERFTMDNLPLAIESYNGLW